jgi:hypothetical protein
VASWPTFGESKTANHSFAATSIMLAAELEHSLIFRPVGSGTPSRCRRSSLTSGWIAAGGSPELGAGFACAVRVRAGRAAFASLRSAGAFFASARGFLRER